ncbi:MAG: SWIM zinc finger family protein [Acetatifactor sp.]|nr:SWIM zinc finger family protein [Acetatifactor sp.]
MGWKKLFAAHILERGYDYYCDNAVENMDVTADSIKADVTGTEDYEVEISLRNGEVSDMYCSCPYAENGNSCKHMAAVLYEWSEAESEDEDPGLFGKPSNIEEYQKKVTAIEKLVQEADIAVVRSYLVSVLNENEKLLIRFKGIVDKQVTEEDVERYIAQVDNIAELYLGRNRFISYREADGFISELEDILDEDVQRMMDNADYMSAFGLMNHIFAVIGNVDMDDSDGGTGMLADRIYQFWLELLTKVDVDEKKEMFCWFTEHLDGSIIDYLEEYIEQIIMEEFSEQEYEPLKKQFIEDMIKRSDLKDSDWSRSYHTGKWAVRFLGITEKQENAHAQIEEFCRKYWHNSEVRKYYIDHCLKYRDYPQALKALDESISMDKSYRGLIAEYSRKKKEIYLLQGDKDAYTEQLWKLVLEDDAGNPEVYKELKNQYTLKEWEYKREELFEKLPGYASVDQLYKEEKLYDRLLDLVMQSSGLFLLQQYEDDLKKIYPEQLLQKYRTEVNNMAAYAGDRKKYQQLVGLLRKMKKIRGGSEAVKEIVAEWETKYRNRPAMMDELGRLVQSKENGKGK